MSEQIKFTEEELSQIKQIQDNNTRIIFQLGETELELRLIEQRMQELNNIRNSIHADYAAMRNKERDLVQQLNTKYGAGQVDLESGVFVAS